MDLFGRKARQRVADLEMDLLLTKASAKSSIVMLSMSMVALASRIEDVLEDPKLLDDVGVRTKLTKMVHLIKDHESPVAKAANGVFNTKRPA